MHATKKEKDGAPMARDRKDNWDGEYCQNNKKSVFGYLPNVKKTVTKAKDGKILSCLHFIIFSIFSRDSRLYKRVCPSIGPSVHPSVRRSVRHAFIFIGQKWAETHKNEIRDDEAGRDYTSHDLFRVYKLVVQTDSGL